MVNTDYDLRSYKIKTMTECCTLIFQTELLSIMQATKQLFPTTLPNSIESAVRNSSVNSLSVTALANSNLAAVYGCPAELQ